MRGAAKSPWCGKSRPLRKRKKRSPATPTNRPAMNAAITTTTAVVRVLLGEVEGISVKGDLHGIRCHRLDRARGLVCLFDPRHADGGHDAQRDERYGDGPEPARQHLRDVW